MNLDIESESDEMAIRCHGIHEFGHALGFMHEYLCSDFPWKLDEEEAKKQYPGWSWQKIQQNVLTAVSRPTTKLYGQKPDVDSIMIYPFAKGVLKNGPEIKWNTQLSKLDVQYADEAYPEAKLQVGRKLPKD